MKWRVISIKELFAERMFAEDTGRGRKKRYGAFYKITLKSPTTTDLFPGFVSIADLVIETIKPLQIGQELTILELFGPSEGVI